jgi:hypothetical protein
LDATREFVCHLVGLSHQHMSAAAVAEMHAIEIRLEDNEPGLRVLLVLEAHPQFEASTAQEVGGELARTASAIAN